MKNYNKDKFVILVSAGPTAREVRYSDKYYTCGVNVTPKLIERTNFWVVNDACYFQDFCEKELRSIDNLALPEFPHSVNGVNMHPSAQFNYEIVTKQLKPFMNIHPFNIHTSRKFNLPFDPEIVYFETKSSNESALRWLIHHGFTKFVSLGQDPDGNYHHKMHSRPTKSGGHVAIAEPLDNNRYRQVRDRMKAIIEETNCLLVRCVLPSGHMFNEAVWDRIERMKNENGYKELEVAE